MGPDELVCIEMPAVFLRLLMAQGQNPFSGWFAFIMISKDIWPSLLQTRHKDLSLPRLLTALSSTISNKPISIP